jgi:rRNA maturation RNase YbeY
MANVVFSNADIKYRLQDKKEIIRFIKQVFKHEGHGLNTLTYIFCSDTYLLEINKQFLHHDFYTDIITFDLSDEPNQTIGEVYVSIERVRDNANALKHHEHHELLRVIIHGVLHLCGYKDKKKSEITIMRDKEDYYLRLFGKDSNSYVQI